MEGGGEAAESPDRPVPIELDPATTAHRLATEAAETAAAAAAAAAAQVGNGAQATAESSRVPLDGISKDEMELYDRQIRLWGIKAQQQIRNANVLLITVKGLANEIAKNLVLAGIGSLTLLDGDTATEPDRGAQFLLSGADSVVGKRRAEAASHHLRSLNPRVRISVDLDGIKAKGTSYFQPFDVIIGTDLDPGSLNVINTATRLHGKPFYAAGTHGMYGYIFCDLIEHDFVITRDVHPQQQRLTKVGPETRTRTVLHVTERRDGDKRVESVKKRELYSTWLLASDASSLPATYLNNARKLRLITPVLSCLRALWEFTQETGGRLPRNDDLQDLRRFTTLATGKHQALHLPDGTLNSVVLRKFLQNVGSEIAPVTAVLGGQLAQDVINVLAQTQQPIQNMIVFDGDAMQALMYPLHPDGALGRALLSCPAMDTTMLAAAGSVLDPAAIGLPQPL